MKQDIYIHWFRKDLRISDNPALTFAANRASENPKAKVLALYILDDEITGPYKAGAASRWWLHHSLEALDKKLGGALHIYKGNPEKVFQDFLMQHFSIKGIYWNRSYTPETISRDAQIETDLKRKGIDIRTFNGSLLWEPHDTLKKDGSAYKVFTPFYQKGCLSSGKSPRKPLPQPDIKNFIPKDAAGSDPESLNLLSKMDWEKSLQPHWQIGETGAKARLSSFISDGLRGYAQGRDYPAKDNVSRLSPHLHFGEISPGQIWHALEELGDETDHDLQTFRKELVWREFSYSLLYNNPDLPHKNLQSKFDKFPWQNNKKHLKAWQEGKTGYPIIDAGMRQLWQTGYMHNRVRMLTGSFLVKNLMLHWKHGFDWFWDTLVDADLANNAASWQWIAGCGADAAPYFRIFNPITQSKKFDPEGTYIKTYVPELRDVPTKHIHEPWQYAKDYPKPIVDLKSSRERALTAFRSLKKN